MKRSVLIGCLAVYFLLMVFLPGNTEGIQLPKQTVPGIENENAAIYPNPAKDFISIRPGLLNPAWGQDADLKFEIRNILGNAMPVQAERIEQDIYRLNVAEYPNGYYLLMIQCNSCEEKGSKTRNAFKFLKQ